MTTTQVLAAREALDEAQAAITKASSLLSDHLTGFLAAKAGSVELDTRLVMTLWRLYRLNPDAGDFGSYLGNLPKPGRRLFGFTVTYASNMAPEKVVAIYYGSR